MQNPTEIYAQAAARYDSHMTPQKRARMLRIEAPMLQLLQAGNCLDLGCGTGRLMQWAQQYSEVSDRNPTPQSKGESTNIASLLGEKWQTSLNCDQSENLGIDSSPEMLAIARKKGLDVLCADAHKLPLENHSMASIVAANGVFRYLDLPAAFRECFRILKPSGALAIHHYPRWTWSAKECIRPKRLDKRHLHSIGTFVDSAKNTGFELRKIWTWRSIRFAPYALACSQLVEMERWLEPACKLLPSGLPRLWSHVVFLFQKAGAH